MTDGLTPTSLECIAYIKAATNKADLYDLLAEEASELAHAANKMARVLRGTNPTPKDEDEIYKNVIEEYTDLVNVADNIMDIQSDSLIANYKLYRWKKRLEGLE